MYLMTKLVLFSIPVCDLEYFLTAFVTITRNKITVIKTNPVANNSLVYNSKKRIIQKL